MTLSKTLYSNQPANGDDNSYLHNMTKAEVMAATSDIMGNTLLKRGGFNLAEVTTAIPPLRSIQQARLWVANRVSGRDATFDNTGSNWVAGTPSPANVAKILTPGPTSQFFDHEGTIGQHLPTLVLNFPVGATGMADAEEEHAHLASALKQAVKEERYLDAASLKG